MHRRSFFVSRAARMGIAPDLVDRPAGARGLTLFTQFRSAIAGKRSGQIDWLWECAACAFQEGVVQANQIPGTWPPPAHPACRSEENRRFSGV